jgi:hypothetical protein
MDDLYIDIYKETGYSHLSGSSRHELLGIENKENYSLCKSLMGGGYFSFFVKKGLKTVGGWDTLFAKYKRYGHTEHTYRFYHSGLQSAPFIYADSFDKMIILHSPESVSILADINENELVKEERELIGSKSKFFPLKTLSEFHFNNKALGYNEKVNQFLKENPQKYPLTIGVNRKKALGEYYALKISKNYNSHIKNLILAIKSMLYSPLNNELKHTLKFFFKK